MDRLEKSTCNRRRRTIAASTWKGSSSSSVKRKYFDNNASKFVPGEKLEVMGVTKWLGEVPSRPCGIETGFHVSFEGIQHAVVVLQGKRPLQIL